jgi:PAS domain S-box-containing protein
MEFLKLSFASSDFVPHGYCYGWIPGLVWLHVISDSLIFLAYMTIPFTLVHIARRRKDLPFNWMFMCFGVFIVACGLTHAMEVWNLWHATYWLAGLLKAVTAAASLATAVLLIQLVPQALNFPSANDLRDANQARSAQGDAVRASELKFRGILESAPDAMVIADAQGRIVLVNAETERQFGYRREELIGQLVDILVPERFREKHPQHREGYTAHPRARTMGEGRDLWGLRKDTTEFPVEISLSPIETPEGTLISSAIRDVTANKRAEKALRASEIKFRGILESAPDAMVIADGQGRIVLVNAETERLFGYGREELIGQFVDILVPERFRGRHPQHREGYTAHPRARTMGEGRDLWGLRKDNTEFPVEISLSPIETPGGTLISSAIRDVTASKRAEKALRASEIKFRGILQSAPDAMVIADGQGRIVLVNAETERLFGYVGEELIGQLVDVLVPERFRGKHPQHREGYTAHPRARTMGEGRDLWGLRKDTTEFPVEISLSPIETPEGTLISSAIRDVTASKRAEKAVRASEAKFRGILESAPDAMVIADGQGRIVLVNAETERLFRYGREELIGQLVDILVPERFRGKHPQHREGYTAHPRRRSMGEGRDLWGLRKDHTEFPVEISLSPIESAEGILVTTAIRDISVRRAAEKDLAETAGELGVKHRLLNAVVEGTTDPIYIRDLENRFTMANGACAKALRRNVSDVVGASLRDLLPNDSSDAVAKSDQEIVRAGVPCTIEETVEIEGITRIFLTTKGPYQDADGKIIGTLGISREITDRKKAEENLVKMVGDLKRSNEELQQFAYVASHDLQEPLRMVASYTQLLAKRYKGRLDADADEFIAYAVDGSNRMQGLIQDLLIYSRAGTTDKALHQISSEKALQDALANLRATIEESGAVVTHDSLPSLTSDDAQLIQVFQNLVGNAIKYHGPELPHVHVSAAKNGGKQWIFSVRDNGLGIDPQYFDRIFVIFQRLHGREDFKGTGIGLAICKKIVERLGGRIWVESQPKEGSTFYFALPERDGK